MIATTVTCQCGRMMEFQDAWLEAPDLVVIVGECPSCGIQAVHIRAKDPGTEEEPDRLDALYESRTEPWEPLPEWWQPPEPDDLHTYDL
jgi:hypothetical protein